MDTEGRRRLAETSVADESARLVIEPAAEQIPRLATLMSKGCFVRVQTGGSLRDLICDQFKITPEYLKNDIKVLFLNFSPVDDVDSARVHDGAVLALSAALPGLVGAAMRKDGLSWMRSSITYREGTGAVEQGDGVIFLKLFNLVMADLGEMFLRRGVYIEPASLADFLTTRFDDEFWRKCKKISRNGEPITDGALLAYLSSQGGYVNLSIR